MKGPDGVGEAKTSGGTYALGDVDEECSPCAASDSYPVCCCDVYLKTSTLYLISDTTTVNPYNSTPPSGQNYMTGNGKSTAFGGFGCKDVNECSDVTKCQFQKASGRNVDLQCINHDPGFECVCPKGQVHPDPYAENNHQHLEECIDLDECATGTDGETNLKSKWLNLRFGLVSSDQKEIMLALII